LGPKHREREQARKKENSGSSWKRKRLKFFAWCAFCMSCLCTFFYYSHSSLCKNTKGASSLIVVQLCVWSSLRIKALFLFNVPEPVFFAVHFLLEEKHENISNRKNALKWVFPLSDYDYELSLTKFCGLREIASKKWFKFHCFPQILNELLSGIYNAFIMKAFIVGKLSESNSRKYFKPTQSKHTNK
jgi:hypothetical protein